MEVRARVPHRVRSMNTAACHFFMAARSLVLPLQMSEVLMMAPRRRDRRRFRWWIYHIYFSVKRLEDGYNYNSLEPGQNLRLKVDIDEEKGTKDNKTMMLNIISLFRNSLSGLKGLNFANDSDKGPAISLPISSKKEKNQITFEGPSPFFPISSLPLVVFSQICPFPDTNP